MVYEPKSQEAKDAIAAGGDPAVVEEMEKNGELTPPEKDDDKEKKPEVVETEEQKTAREAKETEAANVAKGLNPDGTAKAPKEGDGDDDGDKGPDRPVKHIPAWKHKEELKKAVDAAVAEAKTEFDKQLASVSGKGSGNATADDVAKFAEEFNLTPEVATAMIDRQAEILEKRLGVSDIRRDVAASKEREREIAEQQGFENEWGAKATQDLLASVANGQAITAEVKERVRELAYSTTYARYRLPDIVRLEASTLFTAPGKEVRTAEAGRGGTARGTPAKDITEMSGEDINQLSDEEFMKLSNDLGKKGSKYQGITHPKTPKR